MTGRDPQERDDSLLGEVVAPLTDPDRLYRGAARPAVQLPVLVVCLLAGLFSGWVTVAIASAGEPVGEDQDPAAAVALIFAGLTLAMLGLVVGAGIEMVRQIRTTGWSRPTPREQIPRIDPGTVRGVAYLVAFGGLGTAMVAGLLVAGGWRLATVTILGYSLLPLLAALGVVAWRRSRAARRR
ncbi:MAG: hypothetical protein GX555_09620 [Actinomycetales bacterium]|nr:hypothetical protein [Actinomycetales bacterium]